MSSLVCKGDDFLGNLVLVVVTILNGIDYGLFDYDLAGISLSQAIISLCPNRAQYHSRTIPSLSRSGKRGFESVLQAS